MFRIVVSLFVVLSSSLCLENITTIETVTKSSPADDHILCRSCGAIISTSNYLFSKKSSTSDYVYEDTLFGRKEVLVQVLRSDIFFNFAVITTEHSICVTIGEWEVSELWFPGYRKKPCVCPECGAHVGWLFELVDYDLITPDSQFYGLILTNLIGESCNCHFYIMGCLGFCRVVFTANMCLVNKCQIWK